MPLKESSSAAFHLGVVENSARRRFRCGGVAKRGRRTELTLRCSERTTAILVRAMRFMEQSDMVVGLRVRGGGKGGLQAAGCRRKRSSSPLGRADAERRAWEARVTSGVKFDASATRSSARRCNPISPSAPLPAFPLHRTS